MALPPAGPRRRRSRGGRDRRRRRAPGVGGGRDHRAVEVERRQRHQGDRLLLLQLRDLRERGHVLVRCRDAVEDDERRLPDDVEVAAGLRDADQMVMADDSSSIDSGEVPLHEPCDSQTVVWAVVRWHVRAVQRRRVDRRADRVHRQVDRCDVRVVRVHHRVHRRAVRREDVQEASVGVVVRGLDGPAAAGEVHRAEVERRVADHHLTGRYTRRPSWYAHQPDRRNRGRRSDDRPDPAVPHSRSPLFFADSSRGGRRITKSGPVGARR